MTKSQKPTGRHKWTFTSRFRTNAFGWRASRLSCQRIKEAVSEIKKVAKKDPVLGAEGIVLFAEKLWPALQHVDSSSGALGTAVCNALDALIPILIKAPDDRKTRDKWLERLWQAIEDDGVEYLDRIEERWGEICGSSEVSSNWADNFVEIIRSVWSNPQSGSYVRGSSACLSCLLASGRHQELLDLLELHPYNFWSYRKYGVETLLAMGKKKEALEYAEASRGQNNPNSAIDQVCENILISMGEYEEAYKRYALSGYIRTTYLSYFRAILKRYPMKDKNEILNDLVAMTPGEEGKWFAAAKDAECYDLALKMVLRSPCDPKTLNRAARDFQESNPRFALGVAIASMYWLCDGWGYEITGIDVLTAFNLAEQLSEQLGMSDKVMNDIRNMVAQDKSAGMFVQKTLGNQLNVTA